MHLVPIFPIKREVLNYFDPLALAKKRGKGKVITESL